MMYGLGAISLFYFAQETKDVTGNSQDTGRSDVFEFIKKIFAVFLEDTDSLYIILNRNFEISFASKSFSEAFGIKPDQFKSSVVKEFLQKITNIDCIQRIKQLINRQDPKTSENTLQDFAELLFKHSRIFKSHGLGWDTINKKPKIHLTKALIEGQPFDLHFTFVEGNPQNDFLLFKIDFEEGDDQSEKAATPAPETEKKLSVTEVAAIAHELRTPLNGLIFFTQQSLNSQGTTSQVKQEFLEPSLQSAKRLNFIINDILDFAQILEGKFRTTFESFDLETALQSPLQIIRGLGKSKGVTVTFKIDPNVPKQITTDQNRLVQIVYNLLGNALKFTKEGSIHMQVSTSQATPRHVDFSIKDTGYGIKPEDLAKLFQAFEKLDNWHDNKIGTGLGLCISNAIVKTLGGKNIGVKSEYQKGSTFSFSIEDKAPYKLKTYFSEKRVLTSSTKFSKSDSIGNNKKDTSSQFKRLPLAQISEKLDPLTTQEESCHLHPQVKIPKLESNEFVGIETLSPLKRNKTVYFDFNNRSLQSNGSSLFMRKNKEINRKPNTVVQTPTRYPEDSELYIERHKKTALTVQPDRRPASKSQFSSPTCSCYQILAVDDEPMNLIALKMICLELGLAVRCFNSGEDAIKYFTEGEKPFLCGKCPGPLLILMDCNMLGMDGYETSEQLCALMKSGKIKEIPIYACSADDSPVSGGKARQKGMVGSLPKPVDKKRLWDLVVQLKQE